MILKIEDWEFDTDMERTMEHSAQEAAEHCDCAYCRNFYAAVDTAYPELRPFLTQFGLDIEAPEELMPFEPTNVLCAYAVEGRILRFGQQMTHIGGIPIYGENPQDAMINVRCKTPYFILWVGSMELPWVLDEPMEETVSPANEPSFLKKMWDRLLGRAPKSNIES